MPQFQSLKRLLTFYLMTLIILLSLYYAMMVVMLKTVNQQQSLSAFEALSYDISTLDSPNDDDIERLLAKPMFQGLTYQLILMMPSGQTYIHRKNRPGEVKFSAVSFPEFHPKIQNESNAFTLSAKSLTGTVHLDSGAQVYVIIRHKPISIDWMSYQAWLPFMVAISLFIGALLFILKRRSNWELLLSYSSHLIASAKDGYAPPPFAKQDSAIEFLRLGHILGRISHDLHQKHRRIKMLSHRLERLVDKSPLPMLMVMRQGQISFFNQRFEQVFTTTFQRDATYKLTDFVIGIDKATQQELSRLSDQKVSRTLLVFGLEDKMAYQLHLTPWFGDHGQIHGFTIMLSNVNKWLTQVHDFEKTIDQQHQQLAEMTRLRSVIGHELRTPLNAIIGTLDLIDPDNLSDHQKEVVITLEQSSQSMLTMLNDMLEMAKIESGKANVIDEAVDIFKVSQNVSTLMIGSARRQGLELIYAFMPDCPRYIQTDPTRLRQILLNLIDNAIKFTRSGFVALSIEMVCASDLKNLAEKRREIRRQQLAPALAGNANLTSVNTSTSLPKLDPSVLDLAAARNQDWICFRVEDSGIGISLPEQQRLFHYFNQANAQINRQFGGSGLGLAISSSFAKLLGGFILVSSQKNEGSCFELFLPSKSPKFQPMDLPQDKFANLTLIAVVNNAIRCDYLQKLCHHLAIDARIYQRFDDFAFNDSQALLSVKNDGRSLIFVLDYEYYLTTADDPITHDRLNQCLDEPSFGKILLSMTPERGIASAFLDRFDGFLSKPLDVSLFLSELIRLAAFDRDAQPKPPISLLKGRSIDIATDNPATNLVAESAIVGSSIVKNPNLDPQLPLEKEVPKSELPLILVVEDNITNQKITCKLLEKLGYQTMVAEDGEKALAVLAEHRDTIALILMDCRMPIMDGLQATQAIRAMGDDITIVALTANNSEDDKQCCLNSGMDDFLSKPVKKEQLTAVLSKFIS